MERTITYSLSDKGACYGVAANPATGASCMAILQPKGSFTVAILDEERFDFILDPADTIIKNVTNAANTEFTILKLQEPFLENMQAMESSLVESLNEKYGENLETCYGIRLVGIHFEDCPYQLIAVPSAPKPAADPITDSPSPAQPKAEPPKGWKWTCDCGRVNDSKFCPDCGGKRPPYEPSYKCAGCGYVPDDPKKPSKFCPNCGSPFNDKDIVFEN